MLWLKIRVYYTFQNQEIYPSTTKMMLPSLNTGGNIFSHTDLALMLHNNAKAGGNRNSTSEIPA